MATATAIMANETEIANAMGVLGIDVWQEALLDEIELNRRLNKSLEQFKRGETMTLDEMQKRTTERLKNVYKLK
ncbi:MAG: hypothetical protein LBU89_10065 [Fibromonadaceae bacterium]|jgi:hypothetical protein|nr:hypothetical protein [Fibromonadaceae bacterium]